MSNDIDARAFLADFLAEAGEHLVALDDHLLEVERLTAADAAVPDELVNGVFRIIHTLKGMSSMMRFTTFTELAHQTEHVFDGVRSGERRLRLADMAPIFDAADALKRLHGRIEATGGEDGVDVTSELSAIAAFGNDKAPLASLTLASPATAPAQAAQTPAGGSRPVSPAPDLLARVDIHEQIATLVDVAKGSTLITVSVVVGRDCTEMGAKEWRLGLDRIGKVLGMWTPATSEALGASGGERDLEEVDMLDLEAAPPELAFDLLFLTDADWRSVLDVTGVPEACLQLAPLPWVHSQVRAAPEQAPPNAAPVSAPEPASIVDERMPGIRPSLAHRPGEPAAVQIPQLTERTGSIRVEIARLDRLMELLEELIIHHARMVQLSSELSAVANTDDLEAQRARLDTLAAGFDDALTSVRQVGDELQDSTRRIRLLPAGSLFSRFRRIVRDLARDCGKPARLEIAGADIELDKTVIEQIGDPLIHLVRNAIDHGLESIADRKAAGKPLEGVVTLSASRQNDHIAIVVADDGRGINKQKVLAKAKERGLVAEGAQLSDQEIWQLVFKPGLSTAGAVTNISGRGVGMDVVRQNIQKLGGSVQVFSEAGVGTRFVIELPLMLAASKALLVPS